MKPREFVTLLGDSLAVPERSYAYHPTSAREQRRHAPVLCRVCYRGVTRSRVRC
jgi:hypothetical protein